MKRVLAGFLAMILLFTSVDVTAFAAGNEKDAAANTKGNGDISVVLDLSYPEAMNTVQQKDMKAQLLNGSGSVLAEIELGEKTEDEKGFPISENQNGTVKMEALNSFGVPITTESEVNYYNVSFTNLPNNSDYQIALKGKGYKSYLSDKIALKDFSKKIVLDTKSQAFTMGDVNGDGAVNDKDLAVIEAALGTKDIAAGSKDAAADLNCDGSVDIKDIALVNRNRSAVGQAVLYDTEVIAAAVATMKDLPEDVTVTTGTAEDILKPNSAPVTFETSEGKNLSIPVSFEQPVQMEQIEIASPSSSGAIEAGVATVDYEENGKIYTEKFEFSNEVPQGVHAIETREGRSTVVINLGARVAVKKVTITVTKVANEEGKPTYAVVEEIKFLKDIVPANPTNDSAIPKNVQAAEDNETVTLTWKAVDNVTGYMVKYGLESGKYTDQISVEGTTAEIKGLKNLTTYYFVVYAVNGDWKGPASQEINATPQPKTPPSPPDNLKVASGDNSLKASWGKTKNAETYSVYYKVNNGKPGGYTKAASGLKNTSYVITDLINDIEYCVYVTASNAKGESGSSLISIAIPKREILELPVIPTLNRIPNSDVEKIQMTNANNVNPSYGGTFKVQDVLDGDYYTHWTARAWWENKEFIFDFKDPKTMEYVVYVPRLDGNYRKNLYRYNIRVWDSQGKVTTIANWLPYKGDPINKGFAILTFPKTEDIKRIGIEMKQWDGAGNISLSEMAFYDYSGINEKVEALFANKSFTKLADGVTKEQIDDLETLLNDTEGYYVDQKTLLDEVSIARGLLENDPSKLGKIVDGVDSRNTENNLKVINTFQPLGIVANAGKQIVIYADIPDGENVTITPTQYFAEASSWAGSSITLTSGRNIINIPQLMTINAEKGGSLYLQYSGKKASEIKLQIRGEYTQIPVLELADWDDMNETQRREVITNYVTEMGTYTSKIPAKNEQTNIKNSTEISLPNVLLSLPAAPIQKAILSGTETLEQKVDKLYNNVLAWDELLNVLYTTHGVDNMKAEQSRVNIRYMRMFAGAFMYASGSHIGIGYGSAGALAQGRPTSITGEGKGNGLYGWGIAHEIGHQMDTLGKAETTNNIYSLFGQTHDGGQNALPSRLETSNKYEQIFEKTSIGAIGVSNDVFVSLGMYWQLHLAYDLGADDNFYNKVNKVYRERKDIGFSGDQKFAVVASSIAQKDLSEFFERWGIVLSDEAKAEMGQYEKESRKIYYLNDQSRREAMAGSAPVSGRIEVNASIDQKTATVTVSGLTPEDPMVQGYEITRNGKGVGFTKEATFTDLIGSMNNQEITYSVKAIDVLGNVIAEAKSPSIKIQHDNLVPRESWSYEIDEDGSIVVTMKDENISIAGIRIKGQSIQKNATAEEVTEAITEAKAKMVKNNSLPELKAALSDTGKFDEPQTQAESNSEAVRESVKAESGLTGKDTAGTDMVETDLTEAAKEQNTELNTERNTEINTEPSTEIETQPVTETVTEEVTEQAPKFERAKAAGKLTISVSEDGSQYKDIKVFDQDVVGSKDQTYLFDREDGRIDTYDEKYIRITNLPDDLTMDDIDFMAYPGDDIEISETAIGYLESDYRYGEAEEDIIKAGTLIVTGTYRGDPVYNTISLQGRFNNVDNSKDDSSIDLVERPMNGVSLLFAEEPKEGDMTTINNGFWIFIPDVQKEAELTAGVCGNSVLPAEIQAVMYRTDDPDNADSKRLVSNTLWVQSPTEETMPNIKLESDAADGGMNN